MTPSLPLTRRSECPVFVVGAPRSGTTLLYDMLLSSGGFAVYLSETHFFTTFVPRFGNLRHRKNRERLLAHWLTSDYFRLTGLDPEPIRDRLLHGCKNAGDFLRMVMEAIARNQNATRWAEKTPDHVLHLAEIKRVIPDALIIHIIRDGRDTALSIEKQGWVRPFPWDSERRLLVSGVYWEWMVNAGRHTGSQFKRDYVEVRFEDLIEQPEATLSRLSGFIEHDLDYKRIQRVAIGAVGRPNSSFQTGSRANPVGRWKTTFPPSELTAFESLLGPTLKSIGYQLNTPERQLQHKPGLRLFRSLYDSYFSLRLWTKVNRVPMSRHLVGDRDSDMMRWANVQKSAE